MASWMFLHTRPHITALVLWSRAACDDVAKKGRQRGQERAELQCWNYSCYCDGSVFRKLSGSLSFSTTVADDLEFTPLLGFQKCLDDHGLGPWP